MIICLKSVKNYEKDIIAVWQECFSDSEDYIRFFLENCKEKMCVADIENSKVVSFLFMLDGNIGSLKSKYIYAACTKPEYRKQGRMEALIEFSKNYGTKHGTDCIFLVPGNENLYDYYKKFGFISCFNKAVVSISPEKFRFIEDNITEDTANILFLRKELLDSINSFSFTDSTFVYSINEHIYNGGKVLCMNTEKEKGYACCYFNNNNVVIKELLSSKGLNSSIIGVLYEKYNAENVYIQCPLVYNTKDNEVVDTKCGMAYALNGFALQYLKSGQPFYAAMYLD